MDAAAMTAALEGILGGTNTSALIGGLAVFFVATGTLSGLIASIKSY